MLLQPYLSYHLSQYWQMLLQADWENTRGLKMLCGGEALPQALADALLERGEELWNLYGPTETTIWSAVARLVPGPEPTAQELRGLLELARPEPRSSRPGSHPL